VQKKTYPDKHIQLNSKGTGWGHSKRGLTEDMMGSGSGTCAFLPSVFGVFGLVKHLLTAG